MGRENEAMRKEEKKDKRKKKKKTCYKSFDFADLGLSKHLSSRGLDWTCCKERQVSIVPPHSGGKSEGGGCEG